jgi:DNA-binding response OmpR family regulator
MDKKILIVDDEIDLVKGLAIILESKGYEAVLAYDGEEGIKKVKEESPDLIILDIMMPKMDGYTFVKKIKANKSTKKMPIIILTAKDKMKDLFEIEGIKDYVVKPFKNEDLLGRIEKLLKEKEGREGE